MLEYYKSISSKAGLSLDCLDSTSDKFGKTAVETTNLDNKSARVRIYGPIDSFWGFDVKGLFDYFDGLGDDLESIEVEITSPGGNVFDGMAVYSYLRKRASEGVAVTTVAHGIAASIASVIFAAGDTRLMGDGSQLMVHNPHGLFLVHGDLADITKKFGKLQNVLKSSQDNLVDVMASRSGNSKKDIAEMMDAETWFNVEESVEKGFATGTVEADDKEDVIEDSVIETLKASYMETILNSIKRGI